MKRESTILTEWYNSQYWPSDKYFFKYCCSIAYRVFRQYEGFISVKFTDGSSLFFKDNEAKTFYC